MGMKGTRATTHCVTRSVGNPPRQSVTLRSLPSYRLNGVKRRQERVT